MLRKTTAAAVAVLMSTPTAAAADSSSQDRTDLGRASQDRTVSARSASPVRGWSLDLGRRATEAAGQQVRTRRTFETIGVSWDRGPAPQVEVRALSRGGWSPWQEIDPPLREGETATEPLWVGPSRRVQVRVSGTRPGLRLVVVDPGDRPADVPGGQERAGRTGEDTRTAALPALLGAGAPGTPATLDFDLATVPTTHPDLPPRPKIRPRKAWGANPKWRSGEPTYLRKIKQAHVHHTAGSSDYRRGDVPGIIRGMYWYHTQELGWSDIGYNFLIDKFGRIWAGRAGGWARRVKGAHTRGFNHVSFGVASIGNHETAPATKRLRTSLVRLTAWKLALDHRRPRGRPRIWSHGSDRYPKGTMVRLPAIDGHRDTNYTACPGNRLYDRLPGLRVRAQKRVNRFT